MALTDIQKMKEVQRIIRVQPEQAPQALDRIRKLLAIEPTPPAPEPKVEEPPKRMTRRGTRDRMERNAPDRGDGGGDEAS